MTFFTPASRLFLSFFGFGILAAVVYGISSSGEASDTQYFNLINVDSWIGVLSFGWSGTVGEHIGYSALMGFAFASLFIAIFLIVVRDADPEAAAALSLDGRVPDPQPYISPSYWPAVGALGAGTLIVGLVTNAAVFVIGLVILAVVAVEWMITAWADRATGDPVVNRELRHRVMRPVEMPILAGGGVAVLVLAFSRVLLAVSAEEAVWVTMGVALVVFLAGILLALSPRELGSNLAVGLVAVAAVGIIIAGIVTATTGAREFEEHHGEELEELDETQDESAVGTWHLAAGSAIVTGTAHE